MRFWAWLGCFLGNDHRWVYLRNNHPRREVGEHIQWKSDVNEYDVTCTKCCRVILSQTKKELREAEARMKGAQALQRAELKKRRMVEHHRQRMAQELSGGPLTPAAHRALTLVQEDEIDQKVAKELAELEKGEP